MLRVPAFLSALLKPLVHNAVEKAPLFLIQGFKEKRTSSPHFNTKVKRKSLIPSALTRRHQLYSLTFFCAGNNVIIVDFASLCTLSFRMR